MSDTPKGLTREQVTERLAAICPNTKHGALLALSLQHTDEALRAQVETLTEENQLAWNTCDAAETKSRHSEAALAAMAAERDGLKGQVDYAPWRASYMDMRDQRDAALNERDLLKQQIIDTAWVRQTAPTETP